MAPQLSDYIEMTRSSRQPSTPPHLERRLLEDALRGDDEAWRRVWAEALRRQDEALQDRLVDSTDSPGLLRERLAPTFVAMLARLEAGEGSLQQRARASRRLAGLLHRAELAPYVCRTSQWGSERVVHLGLCSAARHMTLSIDSARWDLVRGALCHHCRVRLRRVVRGS